MSDAIIVALITGAVTLVGTFLSSLLASKKTEKDIAVNQAVTNTKIQTLTEEVMEHNGFARRMPVVEEQIKVINHRIDDLEKKVN